jgi:hypothetical protein
MLLTLSAAMPIRAIGRAVQFRGLAQGAPSPLSRRLHIDGRPLDDAYNNRLKWGSRNVAIAAEQSIIRKTP